MKLEKCLHEVVMYIGDQEGHERIPDYHPSPLGNCHSCHKDIVITDEYLKTDKIGIYILKHEQKK